MKSDNDAIQLEVKTCKNKLNTATSVSADCKTQIAGKEIIISRLQQENKDGIDRRLELSNMNKWKSEKEAAESQIERLKSASLEGRYNLLLNSVFSYTFYPSLNKPLLFKLLRQ